MELWNASPDQLVIGVLLEFQGSQDLRAKLERKVRDELFENDDCAWTYITYLCTYWLWGAWVHSPFIWNSPHSPF